MESAIQNGIGFEFCGIISVSLIMPQIHAKKPRGPVRISGPIIELKICPNHVKPPFAIKER